MSGNDHTLGISWYKLALNYTQAHVLMGFLFLCLALFGN
ncbi:putative membrane protein [Escherichia coli DEC1B]|nr:putative membrane protein [Escherichia coli DEC1B]